jgi:hypothetical protein
MRENGRARRFFWYETLVTKSQTKGPTSQSVTATISPYRTTRLPAERPL